MSSTASASAEASKDPTSGPRGSSRIGTSRFVSPGLATDERFEYWRDWYSQAMSPNGGSIVFERDDVLYTMDADGGDVRRLTRGGPPEIRQQPSRLGTLGPRHPRNTMRG